MEPAKPTIAFADFEKLDLRIGTVLECERVPNTDKLLRLTVDFGEFRRQIITGMAEFHAPDAFVGKQFPFLLNLPLRKLKGLVSEGMLIAPDVDGKPVLISPNQAVPDGSPLM